MLLWTSTGEHDFRVTSNNADGAVSYRLKHYTAYIAVIYYHYILYKAARIREINTKNSIRIKR